jgi:GPH family glycoside/pentoside/hexuronide:cation symporter
MADAIDYNEWKHGAKEEGTVYSLHSFFRKLAQGVGPSLVVLIMAALGYNAEAGADQLPAVAQNMRWLVAFLYAFSGIVMFLAIGFIYNLDKKTVEKMTAELNERRAAAGVTVERLDIDAPESASEAMYEILENSEQAKELAEKEKQEKEE